MAQRHHRPDQTIWEEVVAEYRQAHPDVTIKSRPLQNEEFSTKVPLVPQPSEPPDVYQAWAVARWARR